MKINIQHTYEVCALHVAPLPPPLMTTPLPPPLMTAVTTTLPELTTSYPSSAALTTVTPQSTLLPDNQGD